MSGYLMVDGCYENTTVIEKSKFICYIKSIESEEQAKEYIEEIRKKHSFARHNCYAYIVDGLGLNQKFSDAGEPQGTAGMPMLNVLRQKNLRKVIAVVARYFGGIKLGTGGLTRAYGGAVSECLKQAKIVEILPAYFIEFITDYDGYSKILKLSENKNFVVLDANFDTEVKIEIALKNQTDNSKEQFIKSLADITKGKAKVVKISSGEYHF